VINERRRRPTDSADLLSMLMGARDEETGERMTDEQLRVEVTTFLLAGQETTSLALTWTWFLLSQHPSTRQRLEREIDTVLGDRPPEYSDLAHLPYSRMVVDEAMRLYPPAWGFSRQALGDDTLGGFHLPRGWLAFVVPYVLHRLPQYWKDPEAFEPERFSTRAERRSSEVCLHTVRRRTAAMHRQSVRADRSTVERGDAGATLSSAARTGTPRRAVAAHHAAAAIWNAHDH
jgi:cytochrome P450